MPRKKTLEINQLTETNYYILLAIVEPAHGYMIMQKVSEISDNTFDLGPASLYTSLKKLLDAKLITYVEEGRDRKVYSLTEKGLELLTKEYRVRKKLVKDSEKILGGLLNE